MEAAGAAWLAGALAAAWLGAMVCIGHRPRRTSGLNGDPRQGVVFFVESIRWMGVRWGVRRFMRGMRQAGFGGRIICWPWHSRWRGGLIMPVLMDRDLLERQSQRLADALIRQRARHPHRPLHVVGYSGGAYITLRALERLPQGLRVDSVCLLAAPVSAWHDVGPALGHLRGRLVCGSSLGDALVIGLGVLAFGTADGRRHTLAAGLIGLRGQGANDPRIVNVRWRPRDIRLGHWGGHFAATAAGFTRHRLAPWLLDSTPRPKEMP